MVRALFSELHLPIMDKVYSNKQSIEKLEKITAE